MKKMLKYQIVTMVFALTGYSAWAEKQCRDFREDLKATLLWKASEDANNLPDGNIYRELGNVGIGNTTPQHKLDVLGNGNQIIRVRSADSNNARIWFSDTTSTNGPIIGSRGNNFQVYSNSHLAMHISGSNQKVAFGLKYCELFSCSNASHPAPLSEAMTVRGGSGENQILHLISENNNSRVRFSDIESTISPMLGSQGNDLVFFTDSTARMRIASNGVVTIGGDLVQTSDKRYKKRISRLKKSLEKITKLKGFSYYWKDPKKSSKKQLGLIAQEVEKVFPELVYTDSKGYKSVSYSGLIAPLIEAIGEESAKRQDLEGQLNSHVIAQGKKLSQQEKIINSQQQVIVDLQNQLTKIQLTISKLSNSQKTKGQSVKVAGEVK